MHKKNDNSIVPVEINLNAAKSGEVDERNLRQMGWQIEWTLGQMFGGSPMAGNTNITGTAAQLAAFAAVLGREKKYIDVFNKLGLGNERTFSEKWKLDLAIRRFERETGLKWPFK